MAIRPFFKTANKSDGFYLEGLADFKYHPGFAIVQKHKNIQALHEKISITSPDSKILEISTKSFQEIGVKLSAFNLTWNFGSNSIPVECIFQSCKVFENGGPFRDLLKVRAADAKRDPRLRTSGNLLRFQTKFDEWPLIPSTCFYDYVYINALRTNPHLIDELLQYNTFTDIEFNPKKSINCQARSVAIFVSLHQSNLLDYYLSSKSTFITLYKTPENRLF